MDDATWYWIIVAIGFNVAAFGAYVALFKGVLGGSVGEKVHERLDFRASYQITMAGLAATRIFSAAGAGGLVVTYWALRKAGMERRRAACRMVAFLALTYVFYLAALIIFGMAANLIPSPAGGVGSVDAGMIAAFVLFDIPTATVFAAVLTYRVIAFWLPIPPGIIAYVQLRNTVSGWEAEDRRTAYTSESKVTAEATS